MEQETWELGPALLFCPGDRSERFAKAAAASDQAVLDLEDGVAQDAKDSARTAVVQYLQSSPSNTLVRINHPTTERGRADAAAVIAAGVKTLLLPKTESGAEVDVIMALGSGNQRVVVTIETARGVLALPEILARPGIAAISWGPYDIAADIGMQAVRDEGGRLLPPLTTARDQMLLHAAATRTMVLDTVTAEVRDTSVLTRDAREAALSGMRGKFSIHPSQIDIIRNAFRPSAKEVERARRLLAAVPKQGAFLFEGEMIDEPILRRARRILMLDERAAHTRSA